MTTPQATVASYRPSHGLSAATLKRSVQVECHLRLAAAYCKLAAEECAGLMPELAHEMAQTQFGLELKAKAMEKVNAQ